LSAAWTFGSLNWAGLAPGGGENLPVEGFPEGSPLGSPPGAPGDAIPAAWRHCWILAKSADVAAVPEDGVGVLFVAAADEDPPQAVSATAAAAKAARNVTACGRPSMGSSFCCRYGVFT
jgi:hypothetical protein